MNAPYTPDAVSRLLNAVLHPETVDGWDARIEAHGPEWTPDAFAAGEADDATDIKTPWVSEEQSDWRDERNSRPSQY
jgi:hypothetical protein